MQFYIPSKSVPSSAGKASSGVSERMSKNAGHKSSTKSGKGKFGAALMALAKLRSGTASPAHLQHGVPKHAPTGGKVPFGSKINTPQGNFGGANTSPDQAALNPEQQ